MYFSEIDLLPRYEGRGLILALAKHCGILVSQTTFFFRPTSAGEQAGSVV